VSLLPENAIAALQQQALNAAAKPRIYIDSLASLQRYCQVWQGAEFLALDTEFIRMRTFYPKLALIQLADAEAIYLIDVPAIDPLKSNPVEEGFCDPAIWQPFIDLLLNSEIVKVFHACDEDVELLYYCFSAAPVSVFDTQLAAGFLGLDYPMGYQRLVESLCGVLLEKGDSRSNWLQRPLTASQLDYAALDVAYLYAMYQLLSKTLDEQGRLAYLEEDYRLLLEGLSCHDFSLAYRKIKSHHKLNRAGLARLKHLAQWREAYMRQADLPRNKVANNDALMLLARKGEEASDYLMRIEGLPPATAKKQAETIKALLQTSEADFSDLENQALSIHPKQQSDAVRKLKRRLQAKAQAMVIAEQVLLKKPLLELTVLAKLAKSPSLLARLEQDAGWRLPYYLEAAGLSLPA